MTDLDLKVGDRVKARNGVEGTVVKVDRDVLPYRVIFDDGFDDWLAKNGLSCPNHEEEYDIIEVISHRQYVDTSFEVGKTYRDTRGNRHVCTGILPTFENEGGFVSVRRLDGKTYGPALADMLPAPIEDKPKETCNGKTVTIEGREYVLTLKE